MLTLLSPDITSDVLNKALAEKNHMEAKQTLCDMGVLSESECKETGNSSHINKVVDALIQEKMENPLETITKSQVDNYKQGNTGLANEPRIILTYFQMQHRKNEYVYKSLKTVFFLLKQSALDNIINCSGYKCHLQIWRISFFNSFNPLQMKMEL